jgi:hypothetical protein
VRRAARQVEAAAFRRPEPQRQAEPGRRRRLGAGGFGFGQERRVLLGEVVEALREVAVANPYSGVM